MHNEQVVLINNSYLSETPKLTIMSTGRLIAITCLIAALCITSCGGKEKKPVATENPAIDAAAIPNIDIASLKDEVSILDAMQKVVDARLADEKKKKESIDYAGNYLELTRLYTEVISASTAYSKTIADPAKAVEFGNKLSAIQDRMYAK
jgi:hypothetical protein